VRGPGFGLVVQQGGQTLAATLAGARTRTLPGAAAITVGGATYQVLTLGLPGFGTDRVRVSVLSNGALTGSPVGTDRLVAGLLIVGFVLLAFGFAFIASPPSAPSSTICRLSCRPGSPSSRSEQARARRSIRNIGDTFASNLDRTGLLELALKTGMDATTSDRGRLSAREETDQPLIEVDIDNFKSVNDGYGHQQGDRVLRRVSSILRETKRDVDVAARYGGEELCLILPHTAEGDKNSLIAAADAALYAAKRDGKNRTIRAGAGTADILGVRVPVAEPEA